VTPACDVAIVKSTMADIKPGMFVGRPAWTQPDGSQKAIEVHSSSRTRCVAPAKAITTRDRKPGHQNDNANVGAAVGGVEGPVLVGTNKRMARRS